MHRQLLLSQGQMIVDSGKYTVEMNPPQEEHTSYLCASLSSSSLVLKITVTPCVGQIDDR